MTFVANKIQSIIDDCGEDRGKVASMILYGNMDTELTDLKDHDNIVDILGTLTDAIIGADEKIQMILKNVKKKDAVSVYVSATKNLHNDIAIYTKLHSMLNDTRSDLAVGWTVNGQE